MALSIIPYFSSSSSFNGRNLYYIVDVSNRHISSFLESSIEQEREADGPSVESHLWVHTNLIPCPHEIKVKFYGSHDFHFHLVYFLGIEQGIVQRCGFWAVSPTTYKFHTALSFSCFL